MRTHAQLTLHATRGPIEQLLKNLDGAHGGMWLAALNKFNRKENPWDGKPLFAPWKTVRTGIFSSVEEIVETLGEEGFDIDKISIELLHKANLKFPQEVQEFDLVSVTPRELGIITKEGCEVYSAIYQRMRMNGLAPCPPEAIIAARREFPEQEYSGNRGDYDLMAIMKPIALNNTRWCFELRHGDNGDGISTIDLNAYDVDSCLWNIDTPFLCVQPRLKSP